MELEAINALVTARHSVSRPLKSGTSDQQISFRVAKLILAGAFTLLTGGLIGVVGKEFFHTNAVSGVATLIAIGGMFLVVFALFFGLWLKAKPRPNVSTDPQAGPVTRPELNGAPEATLPAPIPSVTESTTRAMQEAVTELSDRKTTSA